MIQVHKKWEIIPYSLANPALLTAAEIAFMAVCKALRRRVKLPVAPIRLCSLRTKRVRVIESTSMSSEDMVEGCSSNTRTD